MITAILKKIINCTFNSSEDNNNEEEWLYAFDLGGLGDALEFKRNAVHDKKYHKALRLSNCGGGIISNNILNSDIQIDSCKGIIFEANHMEGGSIIEVTSSTISLLNNYIYKGKSPSIKIDGGDWCDGSVVQMTGNIFLTKYGDNKDSDLPMIGQMSPYELEFINYKTSAVDSRSYQVSLNQNYRYEYNSGEFGKQYISGLLACITSINKGTGDISLHEPFEEFNKYSYLASENSLIMPDSTVKFESYVNNLQTNYSIYSQIHNSVKWYNNKSGIYSYSAIAIFDLDRKIVGKSQTIQSFQIIGAGILFHLSDIKELDYNLTLRLYRGFGDYSTESGLEYVDLPICGGQYFYDNGISVNGYDWQPVTTQLDIDLYNNTNCNKDIESVSFTGDRVICRGASKPIYGAWKKGDIVFNTSTTSNASMWIYDGNKWIER